MASTDPSLLRTVWWEDDAIAYIDARALPQELVVARAPDVASAIEALEAGAVVGSRGLTVFGAYATALARRQSRSNREEDAAVSRVVATAGSDVERIEAIERVQATAPASALAQAESIAAQTQRAADAIAGQLAALLPARGNVLLYAHLGAGSAEPFASTLAALVAAHRAGKAIHAFIADGGSPPLAAARHGAALLVAASIPCTILAGTAVAALLATVPIAAVTLGAQAIAANGDMLAAIGTRGIAVTAAHHRVALAVAVSRAAIDRSTKRGEDFSTGDSAAIGAGRSPKATVFAPAFDVTAGRLITAIVTEYGPARPPFDESLAAVLSRPRFAMIPVL